MLEGIRDNKRKTEEWISFRGSGNGWEGKGAGTADDMGLAFGIWSNFSKKDEGTIFDESL